MIAPGDSYFRSAVLNDSGDVDAGYWIMSLGFFVWAGLSIAIVGIGGGSAYRAVNDAAAIITATGIAVGAITAAYGTMIGAVALFMWGDNRPAMHGTTTTTSERKTTTTGGDQSSPLPVEIVNPEPVPVVETQRGFAVVLLLQVIAALSVVAAIGYGVYRIQHWKNAAWDKEHARAEGIIAAWEVDKAARIKRTTELTLLLSGKLQTAMTAAAQQEGKTNATFSAVTAQVVRIPTGVRVALPADVGRVLDGAGRAANITRPDARAEASPAAIPDTATTIVYDQRELASYLEAGPRAYADAYNLWAACRAREDDYLTVMMEGAQ